MVGDAKDIDWYAPSGEKIIPNRQDIFVSRSDETTSILTIYHANVDSAGIYKCVAKNGDKEAQATVQVKIFRKSVSVGFWGKCYLPKPVLGDRIGLLLYTVGLSFKERI